MGIPSLDSLAADIRFAFRHFRRTPVATVTMVLVLALGLGTNVVLFTVLNSIATMPPPGVTRDQSLVRIRATTFANGMAHRESRLMSWPEVQEFATHRDLFERVAAHAIVTSIISTRDASAPTSANVVYTTPNYFSVLGVTPVLGKTPAADTDVTRMSASVTAMISYAMWREQFGGASDVIGRTVRISDFPVEIIGVAPPRFAGTDGSGGDIMVWVPLAAYPSIQHRTSAVFASRDSAFLAVTARLTSRVTPRTASPIAAAIVERSFQTRDRNETRSADVAPMLASNANVGDRTDRIISAATAGGFALLVLLITCTNVSALAVGVAVARRKEIGVRLSLGASRRRVVRQLLTETVLLALVAAGLGLVVTTIGIRLLERLPNDLQLVIDWRVTIATCALAIGTGTLFGLSPALHATRVSVSDVLKSSASSVAVTRSRLQRTLVVVQIALTQPLLVGLGVVVTSIVIGMGRHTSAGPTDRIAEIELDTWAGRVTNDERAARIAAVVDRVAAMPGVEVAVPMQLGTVTAPLTVIPSDRVPGVSYDSAMMTQLTAAPRGYFRAFNIPLLRGRDFDAGERARATNDPARPLSYDAIILGDASARRLWGSADPIGKHLEMAIADRSNTVPMVVVGVVDEATVSRPSMMDKLLVFVPYSPINTGVIARTTGPALPMLTAIRSVVMAEAPQMPLYRARTMAQREAEFRRNILRVTGVGGGAGLLALLLSAIGLYAVVSLAVEQRTREIGIRTALGAQRGQVVRRFFAQGLVLSAIGLAIGLPLSMIVTRIVTTSLGWPLNNSPLIGVGIAAVVLVVASLAVWIPARRASGVDPMLALRGE